MKRLHVYISLGLLSLFPKLTAAQTATEHIQTVDDTLLSCTIQFQNPLGDTVHSIVIIDTISPYLDMSTFELGAASHGYEFAFLDNHVVCWIISGLTLAPATSQDDPGGFIRYHIDHLEKSHTLKEIHNDARILYQTDAQVDLNLLHLYRFTHFDYDIAHQRNDLGLQVHVNSSQNELDVQTPDDLREDQMTVEIFNEKGQLEFIGKLNHRDHHVYLDLGFLSAGDHMLSVYDNRHHEMWQHIHRD